MRYMALVNTPGYLSEQDQPPIFDTIREAWDHLSREYSETCEGIDSEPDQPSLDTFTTKWNHEVEGAVYTPTPGIDHDNDLGRVHSVFAVQDQWEAPATDQKPECYQCSSCGKDWVLEDYEEAREHTNFTHMSPADLLATFYTVVKEA